MLSDYSDYFLEDLSAYKQGPTSTLPYGYDSGNPSECPELQRFLTRHVFPFVHSDRVCCEIGSGGGRLTQFLAGFKRVYAVDYWPEMHEIREKFFPVDHVDAVITDGVNLPGVKLLDYLVSLDTFTYAVPDELEIYLRTVSSYLRRESTVVFNYGCPGSKGRDPKFSTYTFEEMEDLLERVSYEIRVFDSQTFKHTNIVQVQYVHKKSNQEVIDAAQQ